MFNTIVHPMIALSKAGMDRSLYCGNKPSSNQHFESSSAWQNMTPPHGPPLAFILMQVFVPTSLLYIGAGIAVDEGGFAQSLSGYTTRPIARLMNGLLPQLIPMLSVLPVNAMQFWLPSGGRAPFGGPVQSVVSKAAMVPAPSMPRLRSSGVAVLFVGRDRAPALKTKRIIVEGRIVG